MQDLLLQARAALEAGRLDDAITAARAWRAEQGLRDTTDGLYIEAVACRYSHRLDQARAALSELLSNNPTYARGWQERGHTELAARNGDAALEAYQQAVRRNSTLLASWRAIAELLARRGHQEGAAAALQQHNDLQALPREFLAAISHFNEDRLLKSEQLCRQFLQANPKHTDAMRLLARIGMRLQIYDDAEFLLESVLEFEPDHHEARAEYVNVLIRRQKFAHARTALAPLLRHAPDDPMLRTAEAMVSVGLGDHQLGIGQFNALLQEDPEQPQLLLSLGHAQKTVGDIEAAVASYRQAYRLRPAFGDAWWSLANTKTYRFSDEELASMAANLSAADASDEDRIHLAFARGKALDDRGEIEESYRAYVDGNARKLASVRYDSAQIDRRVRAQMDICTSDLFERRTGAGVDAPDPIFVVGLPRAGSTLLEQILASHPQVDGTLELPTLLSIAQRLRGRSSTRSDRYPRILETLSEEQLKELGQFYLDETRVYRAEAPRFVDKMPNNFFHVGLIKLILPNAKIIDARRHPMGCCFSGFTQLFGEGQEFTYGLAEIGHYYRRYVDLMDHWDTVLPGFVLRVQYEDVVADLEGQVRRLLDFCNLPFDPACLEFHRTERSVRTPSSEQVRQPIYQSGVEHWTRYADFLQPLRDALGPELLARFEAPSTSA